jgi:hypothetical protein
MDTRMVGVGGGAGELLIISPTTLSTRRGATRTWGRGGRGGVPKPRRGPGRGGRGVVSKPRGGHQKDAGDQVVEKPRGGPGRGRRGVRSPRGGPGGHRAMVLVTITETI